MKKILVLIILVIAGLNSSHAQSLSDLLNAFMGNSTEQKAEPEASHPSSLELLGKWTYVQLDMECEGNDFMAMALASVKEQFLALGDKVGLTAGEDYIRFRIGSTVILGLDGHELEASYSYVPPTGTIILTLSNGTDKLLLTGIATLCDKRLKIMFNAKELITIARENLPSLKENTLFNMAQTVVDNYDGITLGAIFE